MGGPLNRSVVASKNKDKGKGPSPLNRSEVTGKGKGKDKGEGGKGSRGKAIPMPLHTQTFVDTSTQRVFTLAVLNRDTVRCMKIGIQSYCLPLDYLPWRRQRLMCLGVELSDNSMGFLNCGVPLGHAVMIELSPPAT
jgi:hypothetical protein